MLARRLRRRPNIETIMVQCIVFAGLGKMWYLGGGVSTGVHHEALTVALRSPHSLQIQH